MQALKIMWQIIWTVPMAAVWIILYGVIAVGYGIKSADLFIKHWNNFIDEDAERHDVGSEPSGS